MKTFCSLQMDNLMNKAKHVPECLASRFQPLVTHNSWKHFIKAKAKIWSMNIIWGGKNCDLTVLYLILLD